MITSKRAKLQRLSHCDSQVTQGVWGCLSAWLPPSLSREPWYGFLNTWGSRYPNCVLCLTWPFKCLSAPLSPAQLCNLALTEYLTPWRSGPLFPSHECFFGVNVQKTMFLAGKRLEKLPSEKHHKKQTKQPSRTNRNRSQWTNLMPLICYLRKQADSRIIFRQVIYSHLTSTLRNGDKYPTNTNGVEGDSFHCLTIHASRYWLWDSVSLDRKGYSEDSYHKDRISFLTLCVDWENFDARALRQKGWKSSMFQNTVHSFHK